MKYFFSVCLIFSCFSLSAQRQSTHVPNEDIFVGAFMVFPSDKMKPLVNNNMGDKGMGLMVQLVSDPARWFKGKEKSILRIGGNLSYTYFGRFITAIDNDNSLKTTYGLANLNAVARIRPQLQTKLVPFFEVFGGLNTYFSSTKWRGHNYIIYNESEVVHSDIRFSFGKGIAAGVQLMGKDKEQGLILRFSYHWADDTKYTVRNSIVYQGNNTFSYMEDQAPIKHLNITLGYTFF